MLYNIADGGKLFILREGKIVRVIPTAAEDFGLSADGALIAVVNEDLLKLYSVADGLQWVFHGDDLLHTPRFSDDGRLAVASSLGTVYVTDLEGRVLLEKDMQALAVPAWLADGSLLLATWEGAVCRLDKRYASQWQTRLTPEATDMRGKILADDGAPTTAVAGLGQRYGEAGRHLGEPARQDHADDPPGHVARRDVLDRHAPPEGRHALRRQDRGPGRGRGFPGSMVGTFAETSPLNYILIDAYRTQMEVTGVTLVEDPAHPESWLRDASIDYWDAAKELWVPIQPLRSDAAVHTHMFAKSVSAARFRLVLPWGVCGNTRLAEIVFHGKVLGCSHPDAVAKRPLAVLFDEQEDIRHDMLRRGGIGGVVGGGLQRRAVLDAHAAGRRPGCDRASLAAAVRRVDPQLGLRDRRGSPARPVPLAAIRLEGPVARDQGDFAQAERRRLRRLRGRCRRAHEVGRDGLAKKVDAPPAAWRTVRVDLWAAAKKAWRAPRHGLGRQGRRRGLRPDRARTQRAGSSRGEEVTR